jgi:hypothetical protein
MQYESVRKPQPLPPPTAPPPPAHQLAEPRVAIVSLVATPPTPPAPPLTSSTVSPPDIASDELVFEGVETEPLGGGDAASFGSLVGLDRGGSRWRRIVASTVAVAALMAGLVALNRSETPTQSGRAAIDRLRTAGAASYEMSATGTLRDDWDSTATFDLGTMNGTIRFTDRRGDVEVRRIGSMLYVSRNGEDWTTGSLRSLTPGNSVGALVVLPTDVLAIVGLVPKGAFERRGNDDIDAVPYERRSFDVATPKAYKTDLIDNDRLIDIIADLDGPLTGDAWFDNDGRLRMAEVSARSKRLGRDVRYTLTLADFGQDLAVEVPDGVDPP